MPCSRSDTTFIHFFWGVTWPDLYARGLGNGVPDWASAAQLQLRTMEGEAGLFGGQLTLSMGSHKVLMLSFSWPCSARRVVCPCLMNGCSHGCQELLSKAVTARIHFLAVFVGHSGLHRWKTHYLWVLLSQVQEHRDVLTEHFPEQRQWVIDPQIYSNIKFKH